MGGLVISGCASGGKAGGGKEVSAEEGRAKAKAAQLLLADLPAGWKVQPEEDQPDRTQTWQELSTCLAVKDLEQDPIAVDRSPNFVAGLATQVNSAVAYLPDKRVKELIKAYSGDKYNSCSQQAYVGDVARGAPEGSTQTDIAVAPLDFPKMGDSTFAHRMTATVHVPQGPDSEVTVPIVMDVVTVVDGQAVSRLIFLNPGGPFPEDLQKSLVEKVTGRV